ncbi:Lipase, GDSL [Corchorus olitorius]|uniref:Lipase, GDSL n=1 Tax=Corchorus olitorius TaxID=93759 RepID=A0A1R3KQP3_9ROSI|nr:Lipase, GDSL [Corchorus olitorius]
MASSNSPLSLSVLSHQLQPITILLLTMVLMSWFPHPIASSQCKKQPIIFNFGDSNSDTGGLTSGLGFPVNLPNGRSYFRRSTGRLSDGRLLLDFLCQSLNASFLSPYLDSLGGSKFRNGANFAVVGSSTLPKFVPFSLNIQIMQFLHFKARSLELVHAGSRNLINEEGFRNALYIIDIGQNDIADSFDKNLSYAQVTKRIPSVVTEINNAVKTLYNQGGRKFWIHNTGPLGCLPQKLWLVQTKDLDPHGCISSYNSAAQLFNEALRHMTLQLRSELVDATIVYVDIYAIKYDLIANSSKYGFSSPLMACCGSGGPPYNYNIRVTCGQPGYQVCDEGSRFVSWDGIHYTERANSIVASRVLSTAYSTPPTAFDFFCRN